MKQIPKSRDEIVTILRSPQLIKFLKYRLSRLIDHDADIHRSRLDQVPASACGNDTLEILDLYDEFENFPKVSSVVECFMKFSPEQLQVLQEKIKENSSQFNDPLECCSIFWDQPNTVFHEGWLAGGAIANLIYEYIYHVPAVINDVDYFYYDMTQCGTDEEITEEMYNNLSEDGNRHYWIEEVSQVGAINKIKISIDGDFTWRNLLDCFDLNCTEAAFNWGEERLMTTNHFVEFLCSRQVEFSLDNITDQKGFLTCYIRGLQKAQDLNCPFVDQDLLPVFLMDHYYPNILMNKNIKINFDKEIKPRHEEESDKFDDDDLENGPNSVFYYAFIYEKKLKVLEQHPFLLAPFLKYHADKRELEVVHTPEASWLNFFKGYLEITDFSDQDKAKIEAFISIDNLKINEKDVFSHNAHFIKNLGKLHATHLINKRSITSLFENQPMYYSEKKTVLENRSANQKSLYEDLKKDFSNKRLKKLQAYFNEHSSANNDQILLDWGWSLNHLFAFYNCLRKLPLELIGTWEAHVNTTQSGAEFEPMNYVYRNWTVDFISTRKNLKLDKAEKFLKWSKDIVNLKNTPQHLFNEQAVALIKELHEIVLHEEFLITALPITPFKKFAKELTTQSQLSLEGNKMRHCVGGYGSTIKEGRSRIFHLTYKGEHSTVEFGVDFLKEGQPRYRISQNKSFSNKRPHPALEFIAERLKNYLNNYNEKSFEKTFYQWINNRKNHQTQEKINRAKKKGVYKTPEKKTA